MRLADHSYTHSEDEISEGLGEGRDTWYRSREGGLLFSIRMAGGKSKLARPHETLTKKSRKRKPPKASSGMFKVRAP